MPALVKPSDESGKKFEDQCLVIFERHFQASDANFYGRKGDNQNGVDITLTSQKDGRRERVVIQCKAVQSLYWSTFDEGFKQAVRTFGPRTSDDPALLYVLATTAPGEDTSDIDSKAKSAIRELAEADPSLGAGRIRHVVFGWRRIELFVEADARLREIFCRTVREADINMSRGLRDLVRSVQEARTAHDLHAARAEVCSYQAQTPTARDDYRWVPTDMLRDLLAVFLAAGDFEQAAKLTDVALGADPLDAQFLLGHMRAHRVLATFRRDNKPRTYLHPSLQLRHVAKEVQFRAYDLLRAFGSPGEQLTLTLWVVTYVPDQELANAGLRRALDIVDHAWPDDVPRLQAGLEYHISTQQYLYADDAPEPCTVTFCNRRFQATLIAILYSYVRLVHATRFGIDRMLAAEATRGWPRLINGIPSGDVDIFFSALEFVFRSALRKNFPCMYSEGRGREFHWPVGAEFRTEVVPVLNDSRYVCTSEFLLRECHDNLIEWRFAELASCGHLNRGAVLITSHLSLERLAKVQWMAAIAYWTVNLQVESNSFVVQLEKVIGSVVRVEVDERDPPGPPSRKVASYPTYGGAPIDAGDPCDSNIALSIEHRASCRLRRRVRPGVRACIKTTRTAAQGTAILEIALDRASSARLNNSVVALCRGERLYGRRLCVRWSIRAAGIGVWATELARRGVQAGSVTICRV